MSGPAVKLMRIPVAPCTDTSSSNGEFTAISAASSSLDELAPAAEAFADAGVSLLRGTRMSHHPSPRFLDVAEVGHGPTSVDGDVAQFCAELERWLTT